MHPNLSNMGEEDRNIDVDDTARSPSDVDTDKNSDSDSNKESTRTYIARLYVWAFFIVIGLVFSIGLIKCFSVDEYKDMLVTVSCVLSGPLGFIVGYYFKASKE